MIRYDDVYCPTERTKRGVASYHNVRKYKDRSDTNINTKWSLHFWTHEGTAVVLLYVGGFKALALTEAPLFMNAGSRVHA